MAKQSKRLVRQVNIAKQAEYIVGRAQECDARIVALGQLVFFSTDTGDAWMVDPEDGLALCLAREGVQQDFAIAETAEQFAIQWNATYRIDGDSFIVSENAGRTKVIFGYPTKEIRDAAEKTC